jgi:alcohol dehydrogenase, propanol-preferring
MGTEDGHPRRGGALMRAMVLPAQGRTLVLANLPLPAPAPDEVLIKVHACGVCRTDLHIIDEDLPRAKRPVTLGHEIIGTVTAVGANVAPTRVGERVGVPWLGHTCGHCRFCLAGRENLCGEARFTGYDIDGGYADYALAASDFCFALSSELSDAEAAPLLCAGLIGYRSLVAAGDAKRLGIYGFGAAAHLIAQVARHQGRSVYAFTRPDDEAAQKFALSLGASWAGGSDQPAPEDLDAAILFAPVGDLVPLALRAVARGGVVVCAGIHMSDIPSFEYRYLWGERVIRSVANLTRRDAQEFLSLAPKIPLKTTVHRFELESANQALDAVRGGKITGAAVLVL